MRFLLRFFSIKTLVQELLRREFPSVDAKATAVVWSDTFHKVPEMRNWLKRREVMLLKSYALKEKDPEFVLGQVAETKLALSHDVPSEGASVEVGKPEPVKVPSQKEFLEGWKNPNHAKEIARKEKGGQGYA